MTITRTLFIALLPVAAGCGNPTGGSADMTMVAPATFTKVKADVFKISCNFSSCHDATSKMGSLDLATDPYTALIDKPAVQATAMLPQRPDPAQPG